MEKKTLKFENLMKVLNEYGQTARNTYQDKLIQEGKIASGDLLNSVEFDVVQKNRTLQVRLNLEYYWKFVEGGTKGTKYPNALCKQHFPPVNAIVEWIRVKPIIPRPMENGKLPTINQLAYLIGRKIATEGIKPVPALEQTSEEVYNEFKDKIEEAFLKDVGQTIYKELEVFSGVITK